MPVISEGSCDAIAGTGIGAGRFRLETLEVDSTIRLVTCDDYRQGEPKTAAVEVVASSGSETRLQAAPAGYGLRPTARMESPIGGGMRVSSRSAQGAIHRS